EPAHLRRDGGNEVALVGARNAGKAAITSRGWGQEVGDDAQAVPHHPVPVFVPVVALVPLAAVKGATRVAIVHEDAVVVVETELGVDQIDEVGYDPGMVDER